MKISSTSCLGLLIVLCTGCNRGTNGTPHFSLGLIEPGSDIHTTLQITNPYHEIARVTGLEKTCSVSVVAPNNGVLEPGQTANLLIRGHAPRMPGPGAARIDLGIKAGTHETPFIRQIDYTVKARPYVNRTEVWLVNGVGHLHIYGNSGSEKTTCSLTPGLESSVVGSDIEIKSKSDWSKSGMLTINLEAQSIKVPIYVEPDVSKIRLYPKVVSAGPGVSTSFVLVGNHGKFEAKALDKRVKLSVDQGTQKIKLESQEALETEVVIYSNGKEVCRGQFFVD